MNQAINLMNKQKQFLVCIDSDGSAMDTMDSKHLFCFGPAAVEVYDLDNNKSLFLDKWKEINLYTTTRGINRFKGLVLALEAMEEVGVEVETFDDLKKWVATARELSNNALEKELLVNPSSALEKALEWSKKTNVYIANLQVENCIFNGVKACIEKLYKVADIVIVSSANSQAVAKEWEEEGLDKYISLLMGQEAGTKTECIAQLLKKGYKKTNVLMVGDAPLDLEAAKSNGVCYYPILVKQEELSWNRLAEEGLDRLQNCTFVGKYQDKIIQQFFCNLE